MKNYYADKNEMVQNGGFNEDFIRKPNYWFCGKWFKIKYKKMKNKYSLYETINVTDIICITYKKDDNVKYEYCYVNNVKIKVDINKVEIENKVELIPIVFITNKNIEKLTKILREEMYSVLDQNKYKWIMLKHRKKIVNPKNVKLIKFNIYQYISIYINIYQYISIYINIYQYFLIENGILKILLDCHGKKNFIQD